MSVLKLRSTPLGGSFAYWLDAISYTADVSVVYLFSRNGGGLAEVKWQMDLPADYDHPALRRGARIEVMDSGLRVGQATLGEPGRTADGIEFVATGLYRDAERFLCLNGAGNTTTIADQAIDASIARGLGWIRPESIATNAMKTGSATEGLVYLDTLLTSVAEELGTFWSVDADAAVRMEALSPTPSYMLTPGFAPPGIDDTDYASAIFARYVSRSSLATKSAVDAAASARWGYREVAVDLTSLGSVSSARVDNRLAGLLARGKSRLRMTDRIEVTSSDLLTMGGRPADLSMVRPGQVVRMHGLTAYSQWLNGRSYLDFVIGEVSYSSGASTLTIAPLDFTGHSLADRLTNVVEGGSLSGGSGGGGAPTETLRPVGEVTMWYGLSADIPDGWLRCDGSTFSSATYPELATALGSSTLPDLIDRFPVGAGGGKARGTTGGSETAVIVQDRAFNTTTGGAATRVELVESPIDIVPKYFALHFIIRAR